MGVMIADTMKTFCGGEGMARRAATRAATAGGDDVRDVWNTRVVSVAQQTVRQRRQRRAVEGTRVDVGVGVCETEDKKLGHHARKGRKCFAPIRGMEGRGKQEEERK